MKKNITINMCGRLFQIDEDAYELLQQYIESLRQSFGKQEDGEEIVNDIEARVAELFDELCAQGLVAITIEHVKDIITRIGKPEELTGDDEKEKDNQEKTEKDREDSDREAEQNFFENVRARTAGKTLYRNPLDKMVAGVLSGFAAYTGTDATWWRIGYALLFVASNFIVFPVLKLVHLNGFFFHFNVTFILLYIILAIVLPVAKTPKEMLEMQGKDVTPQSLADVVVDNKKEPKMTSPTQTFFSVLLQILMGLFLTCAAIVGLVLLICFVLIAGSIIVAFTVGNHYNLPFEIDYLNLPEAYVAHPWVVTIFVASVLLAFFIPIYAIVHMLISKAGKVQSMGVGQRIIWTVIWIVSMFSVFPSIFYLQDLRSEYRQNNEVLSVRSSEPRMSDVDEEFYEGTGFKLKGHRNIGHRDNPYTSNGEYYNGDENVRYLDVYAWTTERRLHYRAERQEIVEPGYYRLECAARAEGNGVFIYAYNPKKHSIVYQGVPALGNEGGDLGKGWSKVTIDSIVVDNHRWKISYGVTTYMDHMPDKCRARWLSATDFKLIRIGNLPEHGVE